MKTKEEYLNTIELLKQALNFYADKKNYDGVKNYSGSTYSLIEKDEGYQARFALKLIDDLNETNINNYKDYREIINNLIDINENEPIIDVNEIFKINNIK